jgi:O-antigen/teichoic acid export membrane protein
VSIRNHFVAKLGANFIGLGVSVATVALVPRLLGPEGYGRFEFLNNFFVQVRNFADMGTSTCFYTRLSQRPWDEGLVRFYRNLVLVGSVVVVLAAAGTAATPIGVRLYAGEPVGLVALAAILGCLTWWVDTVRKMVDAYHLTIKGEIIYAACRVATLAILVIAIVRVGIDLAGYFVYQIGTGLLIAVLLYVIARGASFPSPDRIDRPATSGYGREFWSYSHPLFFYALVSAGVQIAERWLLQTRAGAAEQGFYGLAYQVGAACFLFTSAMTQILMREFATAWQQSDLLRMRQMFRRVIPLLYVITAYFCVFTSCRARDVAYVVGGSSFEQGAVAMMLMVLYPMHQTYGQLSGSVFFATGATRIYRNIGVIGMFAGLPVVYFLIARPTDGGLGLGAAGLAAKTVLLQFVLVNVQLWFNARLLGLAFWKYVLHQIMVPAGLAVLAFGSTLIVAQLGLSRVTDLIASGALYTIAAVAVLWLFPRLGGLDREELARVVQLIPFRPFIRSNKV